jgi:hypothetical protein
MLASPGNRLQNRLTCPVTACRHMIHLADLMRYATRIRTRIVTLQFVSPTLSRCCYGVCLGKFIGAVLELLSTGRNYLTPP